jgi:hypothetical protein
MTNQEQDTGTHTACPCATAGYAGWINIKLQKPKTGQICIVAAGPDSVSQYLAMKWDGSEFSWADDNETDLDPFPSETATHWMPWPDDPVVA